MEIRSHWAEYAAQHGDPDFWTALQIVGVSLLSLTGIPQIIEAGRGARLVSDAPLTATERWVLGLGGLVQVVVFLLGVRAGLRSLARLGWRQFGVVDQSLRTFSVEELRIAQTLADEGWNVTALPTGRGPGRFPDARIVHLATRQAYHVEFKTVKPGASSTTIMRRVNDSLRREGQARYIIIDARGTGLHRTEAMRALARISGIARGKLDRVRIMGDGFDIFREYP